MKTTCLLKLSTLVLGLFALVAITGCASTKITDREQLVTGPLPKPAHIWVYDFVATPDDVPANSALAGEDLDTTPQTEEQIAEGKKLGAAMATELVAAINKMGMPIMARMNALRPLARRASRHPKRSTAFILRRLQE